MEWEGSRWRLWPVLKGDFMSYRLDLAWLLLNLLKNLLDVVGLWMSNAGEPL